MVSGSRTLDLNLMLRPDQMAVNISKYREWEVLRNPWLMQVQELRNFVFATDTSTTSVSGLPWKNSTHLPKLCQIRDNLHANYMAALFPNDRPLVWEGDDESAESKGKRQTIEAYMENKLRLSQFRIEMSKCVYDWIDYGNCFAMPEFVNEQTYDPTTGETIQGYVGPKAVRVSPLDVVFNPTASLFGDSPKIVKTLTTLGSIKAEIDDHPESGYLSEIFDEVLNLRKQFQTLSQGDFAKNQSFIIDGFSSFLQYFQSDYVEILNFYGDYYDVNEQKFYKNYLITVVDRNKIIRKTPNPSWLGASSIFHCGWRLRPDNLYAMGPLDNLVGMQYRMDHLENAKADGYDLIVHPVQIVTGSVEDYEYGPGERIYAGDEGKVEFIRPDTTMLSADTQIQMYEQKMEEMAGAPKQAMGFRTPGEKTAYEVQSLENGANRIFINKTSYFEEVFMEPLINAMLEIARRNLSTSDVVRVIDDQLGVAQFMSITKDDITAAGKIRPVGARHFARNANIVQNLTQLASSAIGQDAAVNVHISGKRIAGLIEELLGLERYHLVQDNIRVAEQMETQQAVQAAQQSLAMQNGGQLPNNGQPTVGPQPAPLIAGQPKPGQQNRGGMVQQPTPGPAGPVQAVSGQQ